jgi:hypothetical protein
LMGEAYGRFQRGGQLCDLSRPRERRVSGQPRLWATLFRALGSWSARAVIITGEGRTTRAPIMIEW